MRSLEVGARAPAIVLRSGTSETPIISPHGRPRVLALVRDGVPADLAAIRAQLRGLGAELVAISATGAWSLRPDDAPQALPAGAELAEVVATRFGVPRDRDAVFVVGGEGIIRFAHVLEEPLGASLATALAAAVEAMLGRRSIPVTFTRREWATSCLVTGFAIALFGCRSDRRREHPPEPQAPPVIADLDIVLDVNGVRHPLRVDPRTSLLDALRERLGLTGTKKGCDGGQCGACTVHLAGQRVVSCLTLAAVADGQPVVTIEGLGTVDALHPVQAAFIEHDAFQCGFCTPGQIMSAVALLAEGRAKTDDDIREQMSGNLCRCGAYPNIVAAVRAASRA